MAQVPLYYDLNNLEDTAKPFLATYCDRLGRRRDSLLMYGLSQYGEDVAQYASPAPNHSRNPVSTHQKKTLLQALKGGSFRHAAAAIAGMHRATFYRLLDRDEGFRCQVIEAEQEGAEVRQYRQWLEHPFRGCRPPRPERQRGGYPKPIYSLR